MAAPGDQRTNRVAQIVPSPMRACGLCVTGRPSVPQTCGRPVKRAAWTTPSADRTDLKLTSPGP